MSNGMLAGITIAATLLHLLALAAALFPVRRVAPLLIANIGFAGLAAMLLGTQAITAAGAPDLQIAAAAGVEFAILIVAWLGLRGGSAARGLSILAFVAHLLVSLAATIFALTFHMTRLI